ncbi:MAG: hypothetical protein ACE5JI_16495, partial [Acidobacteriota bacterium]
AALRLSHEPSEGSQFLRREWIIAGPRGRGDSVAQGRARGSLASRKEVYCMTRAGSFLLDSGDRFPDMTLNLVDGGTLQLPDGLKEDWNVLLFYRGHW